MEREVGGGIGMGNTCKPMAVSFQCMTKFTTNKKYIYIKKKMEEIVAFFCDLFYIYMYIYPWWLSGKEFACQGRKHRFDPWVGK